SPRLIAACYVLHRLSVPRHSPNALRRLIRSPNRNAEANRPRPSRNDERHTQHFFSAGPGDNARELPPAKDPAKGRPHKPIHNVKEQRTEDGEQRTEKTVRKLPSSSQTIAFPETAQPWWS